MKLLPHHQRARFAYLHDLVMAGASVPLALWLRTGQDFDFYADNLLFGATVTFVAIAAVVFQLGKMYQGVWAYASVHDMVAITRSVTIAILILVPVLFLIARLEHFPRSVPIIQWFLLIAMLGGPRFIYRILKDRRLDRMALAASGNAVPIILIGAGDAAELFLRDMKRTRNAAYRVLAIFDQKGSRVGRAIHGTTVQGNIETLRKMLTEKAFNPKPQRLVITTDKITGSAVRELQDLASDHGMTVARLPKLSELRSEGGDGGIRIRPIDVEDLLGRPQNALDRPAIDAMVRGKRVLVTGAGGTIGSELTRQIAALGPARLAMLDNSEFHLYEIDQELSTDFPTVDRATILGNVRDPGRIRTAFEQERPEIVFHAAALKHVPMVEANPLEGILTNVMGSRIVADACRAAGVRCMVQISTDKAVNPTNVMGATKRLAEAYIQAMDAIGRRTGNGDTRFVAVRFGNVLGSTGSVVPLFQKQLQRGGPLTVTHPEMKRYFMTVREAVELVLQAATTALRDADQTRGKIFVLDMGEPVKILDLANRMIQLAGLEPGKDIAIEFTNLRPGEKLFEELFHDQEERIEGDTTGMTLAAPRVGQLESLSGDLDRLRDLADDRDRATALRLLCQLVPEYKPDTGVASLLAEQSHGDAETADRHAAR
ncbi:polysaccharide biosynthesis protein [Hwanghaeella sp.]|uniref:polysaccharide biosynthesis protein n=1 Tax=Hwanghaeella sp. TaxID=2605943 RepID=UPI003CCC2A6F